jgi:hypothetical protein
MAPGPLIHEANAPAPVAMNPRLPILKFIGSPYADAVAHLAAMSVPEGNRRVTFL